MAFFEVINKYDFNVYINIDHIITITTMIDSGVKLASIVLTDDRHVITKESYESVCDRLNDIINGKKTPPYTRPEDSKSGLNLQSSSRPKNNNHYDLYNE